MEKNGKVFESQEELTGYITGKVKGGYICTVDYFQHLCQHHK